MALILKNLDERTRHFMLEELKMDLAVQAIYISERLNPNGKTRFPELLRLAMEMGNAQSLASNLRGLFNPTYQRKTRSGHTNVTMPNTAPDMLAESEYNRYYIRALCRRAIEDGGQLRIYRAKTAQNPRPESERRIGNIVDPKLLLGDLRANPGGDTVLGVPGGPNSGISVELVSGIA